MQQNISAQSRVRYVFNDAVKVLPMGNHPTLADIALALEDMPVQLHGGPVAIHIAWPDPARPEEDLETIRAFA